MLILAPMQGLTELLFRKINYKCFPNAFDYAISPFLSLTHGNLNYADKKIEDVLPDANIDSIPVIPQILGHEPVEFIALANRLFDLGYNTVNWNLGCPMRRVAAKHRGSGILPFPQEISSILDKVIPAIKPSLSIKMRLGYNSQDEIDDVIPVLNDYPIVNITIHPRIGRQMYGGVVNVGKFSDIIGKIKHPVIYNGDIFTVSDYNRIRSLFPMVKDVMIGRGALYNPLLPMQIKTMNPNDFSDGYIGHSVSACRFIEALVEEILSMEISTQAKIRKIKEYWCLLSKSLPYSEDSARRVLHSDDLDTIKALIFSMTK